MNPGAPGVDALECEPVRQLCHHLSLRAVPEVLALRTDHDEIVLALCPRAHRLPPDPTLDGDGQPRAHRPPAIDQRSLGELREALATGRIADPRPGGID